MTPETRDDVRALFARWLTPDQHAVLACLYGLTPQGCLTFAETAHVLHCSIETVTRRRRLALARLRRARSLPLLKRILLAGVPHDRTPGRLHEVTGCRDDETPSSH